MREPLPKLKNRLCFNRIAIFQPKRFYLLSYRREIRVLASIKKYPANTHLAQQSNAFGVRASIRGREVLQDWADAQILLWLVGGKEAADERLPWTRVL